MPDVILSVDFASEGAPAAARAGTYPIRPSSIKFSGPARARYSVRYNPGTLTVGGTVAISFVQKSQYAVPTPNGGVVWNTGIVPTAGNTLVLFVASTAALQAAPAFATPTTGDDSNYDQVGGVGYQAEMTFAAGTDYVLAAFTRHVGAGGNEGTVKITFTDPGGGFPGVELVLLEYAHAAAIPVTAFVKAQVGEGLDTRPNPMPALALDNTTGQCVVCAQVGTVGLPDGDGGGPAVPAGYVGRYSMHGATDTDGQDVNTVDRVGLSGFGPETVSYDWTPGSTSRSYVGIAFAMTKA